MVDEDTNTTTSSAASGGKKDDSGDNDDDDDDFRPNSDDDDDGDDDDEVGNIVQVKKKVWGWSVDEQGGFREFNGEDDDDEDVPNSSSLPCPQAPSNSNASSNGAVSSGVRHFNQAEDDMPARKKSKNARAVDAMMLASTNTISSLSSTSQSSAAHDVDEELHLLSVNNKSICWKFFSIFNGRFHKNKAGMAHCNLCGDNVSVKGSSTSCMRKHLKAMHRDEWEAANDQSIAASCSGKSSTQLSVSDIFVKKEKEKTVEELKQELINRATNFIIEKCLPFTIVDSKSFRLMFQPFHKDWHKITSISANTVREAIFERGALAKKATMLEAVFFVGSWTCDHWTGNDGATYTTTTFHYIKNWVLYTIIVDFKVFPGTTSGEAIYNNQATVLEQYTTKENIVMGVTDTTASMGVLGKFLRQNGMQHAYCTDHNLQCNAILAFDGELNMYRITFVSCVTHINISRTILCQR